MISRCEYILSYVSVDILFPNMPRSDGASIVKRVDKANHDSVRHVADANLGVFEIINISKRWCIVYKHFDTRKLQSCTERTSEITTSMISS